MKSEERNEPIKVLTSKEKTVFYKDTNRNKERAATRNESNLTNEKRKCSLPISTKAKPLPFKLPRRRRDSKFPMEVRSDSYGQKREREWMSEEKAGSVRGETYV
ncbi:hypothetical protein KM043_007464 [Ampulex compressa]|nr:hypothetical protein KM043_007464 [Ampulex compressa]